MDDIGLSATSAGFAFLKIFCYLFYAKCSFGVGVGKGKGGGWNVPFRRGFEHMTKGRLKEL